MSTFTPSELISILHLPYPETSRNSHRYASLDMLKELYEDKQNSPEVHKAQLALKTAMLEWKDDEVVDFLQNYLFEPSQFTDLSSRSPEELRQVLNYVYSYIFGDTNQ